MKNAFLTLFFLGAVYQAQGQDPQLFDNDWFVEKVIIDEVEFDFLGGSAYGVLNFNTSIISIGHPNCKQGVENTINYIGEDSFTIEGGPSVLLGKCSQPDDTEFMFRHFSIYHNLDTGESNNPFIYAFEEDGGIVTLTVTNVDGNQAIYTDESLGVSQNQLNAIVFYPNPVQNRVTIISPQALENSTISIFNLSGKRVVHLNEAVLNTSVVNVSNLKRGVYFLVLTTASGSKRIEKIIK